MHQQVFVVPLERGGITVQALLHELGRFPNSVAQGLVDAGCVQVAGRTVDERAERLAPGTRVQVVYDQHTRYQPRPRPRQGEGFRILFEDKDLLVVEKDPGLLSVPTPDLKAPSLAERLFDSLVERGIRKPQIYAVHRLDRQVSGLLVFARSFEALWGLVPQFETHVARRRYLAIAEGVIGEKSGTLRSRLSVDPVTHRVRPAGDPDEGKSAVTHWHVAERFEDATLLRLELETGRKNQIRVQFAEFGHPLVGDERYGKPSVLLGRVALHAEQLEFEHPVQGGMSIFRSPLPRDLLELLHHVRTGGHLTDSALRALREGDEPPASPQAAEEAIEVPTEARQVYRPRAVVRTYRAGVSSAPTAGEGNRAPRRKSPAGGNGRPAPRVMAAAAAAAAPGDRSPRRNPAGRDAADGVRESSRDRAKGEAARAGGERARPEGQRSRAGQAARPWRPASPTARVSSGEGRPADRPWRRQPEVGTKKESPADRPWKSRPGAGTTEGCPADRPWKSRPGAGTTEGRPADRPWKPRPGAGTREDAPRPQGRAGAERESRRKTPARQQAGDRGERAGREERGDRRDRPVRVDRDVETGRGAVRGERGVRSDRHGSHRQGGERDSGRERNDGRQRPRQDFVRAPSARRDESGGKDRTGARGGDPGQRGFRGSRERPGVGAGARSGRSFHEGGERPAGRGGFRGERTGGDRTARSDRAARPHPDERGLPRKAPVGDRRSEGSGQTSTRERGFRGGDAREYRGGSSGSERGVRGDRPARAGGGPGSERGVRGDRPARAGGGLGSERGGRADRGARGFAGDREKRIGSGPDSGRDRPAGRERKGGVERGGAGRGPGGDARSERPRGVTRQEEGGRDILRGRWARGVGTHRRRDAQSRQGPAPTTADAAGGPPPRAERSGRGGDREGNPPSRPKSAWLKRREEQRLDPSIPVWVKSRIGLKPKRRKK